MTGKSAMGRLDPGSMMALRPAARTVTLPRPSTAAVPAPASRMSAVCEIDAQHEVTRRQLLLQQSQAALAEVAEAGVVRAALGVVVVGDDRGVQAQVGQQVQAGQPGRVRADLVDLVDRDGVGAEGECRRAGERHEAAVGQLARQERGDLRGLPLAKRVARAARSGEHEVGVRQACQAQGADRVASAGCVDGACRVRGEC